jgi:outer membrane protein assembly factor BamE (lipoprotein component of BamABCDE complex)
VTARTIIATVAAVLCVACVQNPATPAPANINTQANTLTHGNVQLNLKVGETTQTQVLETFGAPNITSMDGSNQEVWTYQRHATVSQSSSAGNYWTIILAGGRSQASGFEQSQRTTTLIVKFDANKVVSDFKSRNSEF